MTIGGDGRADSPGHTAKYGMYTAIELEVNKIIDIQLVQVNRIISVLMVTSKFDLTKKTTFFTFAVFLEDEALKKKSL